MDPGSSRRTDAPISLLVTGGSSGIGAAIVGELAGCGCDVVAAGRDRTRLEAVAARASERVSFVVGDITDDAHRDDLVRALAAMPPPRGLIHAAGVFETGTLAELDPERWRASFAINVESRWALSRDAADLLDGGRMLFIGSDAAAHPRVGAGAYSIAQAASQTLRRVLQAEWADSSRAVGSFKPGLVDTEMVRSFRGKSTSEFPGRSVYDGYVADGKLASADRVAEFARWLLLEVPVDEFVATDWDIRDAEHHPLWATAPLYPSAVHPDAASTTVDRASG